jgi:flagellar motility protein MotE (MotC chaperone)
MADLPRQVRGELDLMRSDILPAESVVSMQGDLHVSAAAADRIASSAETISPLVVNERRIVLDEMSRQRALVMDAISVEREQAVGAIVRAFASERSEMLRNVDSERLATLEWATNERREAFAEVRRELAESMAALRSERVVVVDDVRHIVDLVLLRVAIFLVAAVVLAPLVAHAYVRVWPRR